MSNQDDATIISKGKTKVIMAGPLTNTVFLETQDVLTGGDAAKREMITGIGIHKTTQAANVFSLLNKRGLSTAFIERASPNTLLCHQCKMLPLELVVRRYAWGSYLQR
jgi:phosphoribosylaminoimidazole-succinocarboxamide synthase